MNAPLLVLIRPLQWVKNLILFAALVFGGRLFEAHAVVWSLLGFAAFCLLSSAAYVLNDIRDAEKDRRHPEKRLRPIPSGQVAVPTAAALGAALLVGAALLSWPLGLDFVGVMVAYAVLQVAYSLGLKNVVILDVMSIATGFVLRAVAGGAAIDVEVSPWLIICTFLLALFLGFVKRRHEVTLLERDAGEHRASLREYSPYYLDQMISVVTASTVVAYAFYTVSPEVREKLHTDELYLTIPFVLYGIFRYLYVVHQRDGGGDPTRQLMVDPPLWVNVGLWIGTAVWLLYR